MKHAVILAALVLAACGRDERPAPVPPSSNPGVETPEPACSTPGRRDDAGRPIPQC